MSWCHIVRFHYLGAKLSIFLSWCQIVRLPSLCQVSECTILVPNCLVPDCPTTLLNHQRTHQTNLLTYWDPAGPPIDILGPCRLTPWPSWSSNRGWSTSLPPASAWLWQQPTLPVFEMSSCTESWPGSSDHDHDHDHDHNHQARQQKCDSSSDIKDCKYCSWCGRPWKRLPMLSWIVARSFIIVIQFTSFEERKLKLGLLRGDGWLLLSRANSPHLWIVN